MIDTEINRLRRLRGSALRVRAMARAFAGHRAVTGDHSVFVLGGCAAWRIARSVSGRLRAHPHASFQKDAGVWTLLCNEAVATVAAFGASRRHDLLRQFQRQVERLERELSDARALTWASDLSESFGRVQMELRRLVADLRYETEGARATWSRPQSTAAVGSAEVNDRGWPYLAF